MITNVFLKIYDYFEIHKRLMYLILSIIILILTLCASQLKFGEDISDFLPNSNGYSKVNKFVQTATGNSRIMIFFQQKDTLFDTKLISECMDKYVENLHKIDQDGKFANVVSHFDETIIAKTTEYIQQNIAMFLDSADYERADSLLTLSHAENSMEYCKKIIKSPAPSFVKNIFKNDPLGLFSPKLEILKTLRPSQSYEQINGYMFEPEEKRGIVFYDSPAGMSESNLNAEISEILLENAKTVSAEFPQIDIKLFGAPLIAVGNSQQIKNDTILTTAISLILIAIILWFSVRSFGNIALMVITLGFGYLAASAAAWIIFGKISLIAVGVSVVFTGIAINYPLHFITHLYHSNSLRQNMKEIISPLVTGNITTVAAFFSLMFAGSDALRDLGFFGGILLTASILFTLIFLPHFVKKVEIDEKISALNLDFKFVQNKKVALILILITPILIYFSTKTEFDDNLHNINYMNEETAKEANHTFSILNSDSLTSVFAVATGKNFEQAIINHELLLKNIKPLIKDSTILKISGVGNMIVSDQLRKQKAELWSNFVEQHKDSITNIINVAAKEKGLKPELFESFINTLNKDFETIDDKQIDYISKNLLNNYITHNNNETALVSILKINPNKTDSVVEQLNKISENIIAYDEQIISKNLTSMLNDNFNFVLIAAGVIVFLFLTISFGSIEMSIIAFVPLTLSWFWILGIMYLFGIKFNIVNIILATFIFGQGDDYAVFITEGLMYDYARGKQVLKSFKGSVIISSLIMFVGIGSLILAKHPAMSSLGTIIIIGMLTVVVSSLIFPPLLFDMLTKKKNKYLKRPYTIKRILGTLGFFSVFVCACIILYIRVLVCGKSIKTKTKHHKMLQRVGKMSNYIPGVPFEVVNNHNKKFDKPAIIIANHSSSFDVLCMMSLSPKLLFLTNDQQQKNPLYGSLMKHIDFMPVSLGYEILSQKLKPLIDEGFSIVVFPEGTRSTDSQIHRFHQGAFYLAEKLNLDIIPTIILGAGEVLGKKDYVLNEGKISIYIGERINKTSPLFADTVLETARNFRHYIIDEYNKYAQKSENNQNYVPLILDNYRYKGSEIMKSVKEDLKNYANLSNETANYDKVVFKNCGYGATALLYSLTHRQTAVYATNSDLDQLEVARSCKIKPKNLIFTDNINDEKFDKIF